MAYKFPNERQAFIHQPRPVPGPSNADVILALQEGDERIIETLGKGRIDGLERKLDKLAAVMVVNEVLDECERRINVTQQGAIKGIDGKFVDWCGKLDDRLKRLEAGGRPTGDAHPTVDPAGAAADFCVNAIDEKGNVSGKAKDGTLAGGFIEMNLKTVDAIDNQTDGFNPDKDKELHQFLVEGGGVKDLAVETCRWIILILGRFGSSDGPQGRARGRKGAA